MKINKGFTLIEILMALLVITMGSIFIHRGFSQCLHAVLRIEESLQASFLLEKTAVSLLLNGKELSYSFDQESPVQEAYSIHFDASEYRIEDLAMELVSAQIKTPRDMKVSSQILIPKSE